MKFIINAFAGKEDIQIDYKIIEHIIKKYAPEEVYIIAENKLQFENIGNTKIYQFEYWDLYYGLFMDVDWNELIPLDESVIKKASFLQIKAMNILERDVPYYSYSIRNNNSIKKKISIPIDKNIYATSIEKYYHESLSYLERERIYERHLRFWNHFFSTKKIDLVITKEAPHNTHEFMMYEVAKLHGVSSIMSGHTPIINSSVLHSDYEITNPEVLEQFELLKKTVKIEDVVFSNDFQEEWVRVTSPPEQQYVPRFDGQNFVKKRFRFFIHRIKTRLKYIFLLFKNNFTELFSIDFLYHIIKRPHSTLHKKLFRFYERNCVEPVLSEKYIYYPLHFQPEATTSPLGGVYANQLLVINMITASLPDGYYLYVKEHPIQDVKWRNAEFYIDLIKNSKVKLISKKYNSFKLLQHCIAVCTITGTAGWEGLFKGKPCLLFGKYIYMYAPGVFRINSVEDCKKAIELITNGFTFSHDDLKYFLKALENISILTSGYVNVVVKSGGNIENSSRLLADAFSKKIDLILKK